MRTYLRQILSREMIMGWKRNFVTWLYDRGLLRFEPIHFLKAYVYPLTVRGKRVRYKAVDFADSYYRSAAGDGYTDRITISPDVDPLHSEYHYNATENSIIRAMVRFPAPRSPAVLDIGSGAGHWIDFWRGTCGASAVCGLELSNECSSALVAKYAQTPEVSIIRGDIADKNLRLGLKFDVINAIGVIFHIVDDVLWHQALENMRQLLSDSGVIVIGGYFGFITADTQFHLTRSGLAKQDW
jgi:SAM-dependent methyltransferase